MNRKKSRVRGQYLLTLLFRYEIKVCTLDTVRLNDYNRNSMLRRAAMFDYMTAQEAAEKWNVSLRWVQRLCKENRIDGIINVNRVWLIPKDTQKPADARRKENKKGSL